MGNIEQGKIAFMKHVKRLSTIGGMSNRLLAKKLDVSETRISAWLKGKELPSMNVVVANYEQFGMTPCQVLGIPFQGKCGVIEEWGKEIDKALEEVE